MAPARRKSGRKARTKLALVGAGAMANAVHYPSLAEFPDVEMAGLCDVNSERLRATAGRFGIARTYADYRRMLDETAPDAVYVLMPPHHLFDIVIDCLSRGLHVFIEKPPGVTRDQTRQLAEAAAKHGCLTMVGFQRRFAPLLVKAKAEVLARGPLLQCQASFFKCYRNQPPYYGGAIDILTSDAIHSVDLLRWMGGEARKVVSSVRSIEAAYDNSFNAFIEFESGAIGFLSTNWVSGTRIFAVEMHGLGVCALADPEQTAVIHRDGKAEGETYSAAVLAGGDELYRKAGFRDENRHFIDCVRAKRQPATCFADAVRTMELVDRIYHSRI